MKRSRWMTLIHTALQVGEARFARLTALQWLGTYPGDLEMQHLYARALLAEGLLPGAREVAAALAARDPEDAAAVQTWALTESAPATLAWGTLAALEGDLDPAHPAPPWSQALFAARRALQQGDLEHAEAALHTALSADVPSPLIGITQIRLLHARQPDPHSLSPALHSLTTFYRQKFPRTLAFALWHAEALLEAGQEEQAVSLLHQVATDDLGGRVARRLWGPQHPYRHLWPPLDSLTLPFEQPVPAAVAAALGWNRLPTGNGSRTSTPPTPPRRPQPAPKAPRPATSSDRIADLRRMQQELKRLALEVKQADLLQADARFPVYVVLSTRRGLENAFGRQTATEIQAAMQALVAAIGARRDWDALLLLADDPQYTAQQGLEPVAPKDPWAIKLLLADLDEQLARRGLMIGAVLIVGGDEVVPFHRLPNPVDDRDAEIPSDAPYGTRDENYFVAEWPVGRLPGREPGLLLARLRDYCRYHRRQQARQPWYRRLWEALQQRWYRPRSRPGFGYAAAIWERSAVHVLRPIGDPKDLWTSPPIASNGRPVTLPTFPMAYFNLHGEPDQAAWFGQADPLRPYDGEDYPIALKPADLLPKTVPEVVFTEACYGAHVFGKQERDSLALRFLGCGTQALVGCTVTAYGSPAPPLYAADLLGHTFWKQVMDGDPVGIALQKARLGLAREMHRKQGYVDGEDQKTLISFVLYGDPLFRPQIQRRHPKAAAVRLRRQGWQVKTVCDRITASPEPIPPETLEQVRQIVARYLPGMQDAQFQVGEEHVTCRGDGHRCPTAQLGAKARPGVPAGRRVVVLSKSVQRRHGTHHHYARLTLDAQGRVVKIAVSR